MINEAYLKYEEAEEIYDLLKEIKNNRRWFNFDYYCDWDDEDDL